MQQKQIRNNARVNNILRQFPGGDAFRPLNGVCVKQAHKSSHYCPPLPLILKAFLDEGM